MSLLNPESEYESLLHVMRRLSSWYPEIDEDELLAAVVDEFELFDGARMREYVPLLVERNLRSRILHESFGRAA